MDYKQKYEQALERAKVINPGTADYEVAVKIFPELKDGEDEKVRKKLIKALKECGFTHFNDEFTVQEALNWLEKQGQKPNPYSGTSFEYNGHTWGMCARDNGIEILIDGKMKAFISLEKSFIYPQPILAPKSALEASKEEKIDNQNCVKTADKVEPKFKVDDWITNGNYTWKIVEVKPLDYILKSQDGNIVDDTISYVDEQFHPFAIEDAEDGDVLAFNWKDSWQWQKIIIFKSLNESGVEGYGNTFKNNELAFKEDVPYYSKTWTKCLYPATKEQRDLLFQKMKEAGYKWDAEKKELQKIEPNLTDDEKNFNAILKIIRDSDVSAQLANKLSSWLKSLRTLPKQEWSEEDEQMINDSIKYLELFDAQGIHGDRAVPCINGLKSLKERMKGE